MWSLVAQSVSLMMPSNRDRLLEEIDRTAKVPPERHGPVVPPHVGTNSGGVWSGAAATSEPGGYTRV